MNGKRENGLLGDGMVLKFLESMVAFFSSRRNLLKIRVKSELIAACGNRCDLCPAFNENASSLFLRKRISKGWKKYFNMEIAPEEIDCVGCRNKGKVIDRHCPVRACVRKNSVDTCAECSHFICGKLKPRVKLVEEITNEFPNIPRRDYKYFIRPYDSLPRLNHIRQRKGIKKGRK